MKRAMMVAWASVAPLAGAQVVPVELPEQMPEWATPMQERNAALAYHRLWLVNQLALDDIASKVASSESGFDFEAGSDLDVAVASNDELIADLLEATRIPRVDWQTPYERGVGAELPHLQQMRASARVLAADAARLVRDGDIDGASQRLAAMYDLARHASDDRVLIASLVGIAIGSLASERVGALLDEHALSPEARQSILAAIDRMDPVDPFFVRRALLSEGEVIAVSLLSRTEADRGHEKVGNVDGVVGGHTDAIELLAAGAESDEALRNQVARFLAFYRDANAVWEHRDAQARLAALTQAVAAGEYGLIAPVIIPAVDRMRAASDQGAAALAETRSRLEAAGNPSDTGQDGRRGPR